MSTQAVAPPPSPTAFGHPAGLFTLFFAEMWERFSFYGMRALLLLYMIKGFLKYPDSEAYTVYGAYTALVYMTPFFGGMLADQVLGARRAVMLGAILMSAGHFLMMWENQWAFFTALALLIAGNGFFKPNISTIVGSLYPPDSPRREVGFTIFYMGINLGAGLAPLLCGYLGERYGWHYGFGLATLGMLSGLLVFSNWTPPGNVGQPPNPALLRSRPIAVSQVTVVAGAVAAAIALMYFHAVYPFWYVVNGIIAIFLVGAAAVSAIAQARSPGGWITLETSVYVGTAAAIPVLTLLVSGFAPLTTEHRSVSLIPQSYLEELGKEKKVRDALLTWQRMASSQSPRLAESMEKQIAEWKEKQKGRQTPILTDQQLDRLQQIEEKVQAGDWENARQMVKELAEEFRHPLKAILYEGAIQISKPAGLILFIAGIWALGYLVTATFQLDKIARERMYVVFTLTFFSMMFWAFFEQAGSSLNNFTDRNVDRVFETQRITPDMVGQTIEIHVTQEQLGYRRNGKLFTLDQLDELRKAKTKNTAQQPLSAGAGQSAEEKPLTLDWTITEEHVGMGLAKTTQEIPTTNFQAVNPICILLFGLVFSGLWTFLRHRGVEPSTPLKFALGLLQLGLGYLVIWYGAKNADERGMVALRWLLLGYLLHTTGELCLSPVGLSMITRLAPTVLVSTVMGAWFLATAFSQFLAAIIAQFTNVTEGLEGQIPPPRDTVDIYGDVFRNVGLAAVVFALICMFLVPLLKGWMHEELRNDHTAAEATHH